MKEKYKDLELESEESSELEDEDGFLRDNKQWDNQFLKLVPLLAQKDPKIKELAKQKEVFEDVEEDEETKKKMEEASLKQQKPLLVKDYLRDMLLENEGKDVNSDEETQQKKTKVQFQTAKSKFFTSFLPLYRFSHPPKSKNNSEEIS